MIDTTLFPLEELLKQLYWVHIDDDLDDAKQLIPAIKRHHQWADFDLSDFHCFLSFLLVDAISRSARSWISFLLDEGVDVTEEVICQSLSPYVQDADTLFVLELLREKGWDVNSRCSDGVPYLHLATLRSDRVLSWFIEQGADVNLTNHTTGDSLLDFAAYNAPNSTIQLLKKHTPRSGSGAALHFAAIRADDDAVVLPIMESLIEDFNLDVNLLNKDMDTPLHAAIWSRSTVRASMLLQHGANPTATGIVRDVPLLYARDIDHAEMAALLATWIEYRSSDHDGWVMVDKHVETRTDFDDDFEDCIIPAMQQLSGLGVRI